MTHLPVRRLVAITGVVALLTSASLVLVAQGGGGRGGQAPGQPTGGQRGAAPPPGRGGGLPPRDGAGTTTTVGTASISGSVIVEGSGAPVRRARVTLTGAELRGSRSAVTDDQGRFSMTSLPAGRFTLTASKAGFVDNTYGAKRAGRPGTPIQLAEGQALDRRVVSLPRGGVITGVVVDDIGEPAAGTQVRVLRYVIRTGERMLQQSGQATADDRGVYRIYQLQPGDYVVNALPRNMSTGDLRQSITNEVQALMQQAQTLGAGRGGGGGQNQPDLAALANLAASGRSTAVLDRIAQLQQQLQQSDQEQPTAYAPVYYPGTTSASGAQTITLGVSEERAGVDFQLQLVPTARVNGIVSGPNGTPQGTQIALVPVDRGGLPGVANFGMNQARVGADGRFSFSDVTPGQYSLQARATIREGGATGPAAVGPGGGFGGRGGPGGPGGVITQVLWAGGELTVGGQNINDIVLNLQNGLTIGGRVEFQPGALELPSDLTRVRVMLTPRGAQTFDIGGTPPGQADASGRFSIAGVSPGRYTVSANILPASQNGTAQAGGGRGGRVGGAAGTASGQWTLKSAVVDGRDILDFPLEIGPSQESQGLVLTFSDKTQELSGTLQDASGRPTPDFTIILFPTDSRYWLPQARRIASARPGTDGRFTIRGVPPGQYRLTAVTDVEPGEWYDPAFLGQVQGASIPITLAEGDKKVQDIRLAGGN